MPQNQYDEDDKIFIVVGSALDDKDDLTGPTFSYKEPERDNDEVARRRQGWFGAIRLCPTQDARSRVPCGLPRRRQRETQVITLTAV